MNTVIEDTKQRRAESRRRYWGSTFPENLKVVTGRRQSPKLWFRISMELPAVTIAELKLFGGDPRHLVFTAIHNLARMDAEARARAWIVAGAWHHENCKAVWEGADPNDLAQPIAFPVSSENPAGYSTSAIQQLVAVLTNSDSGERDAAALLRALRRNRGETTTVADSPASRHLESDAVLARIGPTGPLPA
jgi:hypothetical protein